MHERNLYVFIASVAEEAINNTQIPNSEIIGFFLTKKLLQLITSLRKILINKTNAFNLNCWDQFTQSKEYKDIFAYITKEYDVFKVYFDSILEKVNSSSKF